jgi:fumarate reductase subunit D
VLWLGEANLCAFGKENRYFADELLTGDLKISSGVDTITLILFVALSLQLFVTLLQPFWMLISTRESTLIKSLVRSIWSALVLFWFLVFLHDLGIDPIGYSLDVRLSGIDSWANYLVMHEISPNIFVQIQHDQDNGSNNSVEWDEG